MMLGLPLPFALLVLGQDTVSHCARRPIGHPGGFGILAVKRHSDTLPLLCPKNCRKKECTRSILVIISLYIYIYRYTSDIYSFICTRTASSDQHPALLGPCANKVGSANDMQPGPGQAWM